MWGSRTGSRGKRIERRNYAFEPLSELMKFRGPSPASPFFSAIREKNEVKKPGRKLAQRLHHQQGILKVMAHRWVANEGGTEEEFVINPSLESTLAFPVETTS